MAGMLPGVECARRRRCYQNKIWSDSPPIAAQISTRRSVLCLYTSNHETLLAPNPSLQRGPLVETREDDRLDEVAREAKRRLDKRLRSQMKSEDGRYYNHGVSNNTDEFAFHQLINVLPELNHKTNPRFSWFN